MVVIFPDDAGGVSVITPTPEALDQFGIKAIALKDVPAGKPFKIVPVSFLPTTVEGWKAWKVDQNTFTDGVGATSSEFPAPVIAGEAKEDHEK